MTTRTDTQRAQDLDVAIATHTARVRPTQGGYAAIGAMRRAARFACLVRDEGPDNIGAYLDDLTIDQLYALTVTLAAMVDPDVDVVEDRLEWLEPVGRDLERAAQRVRRDEAAA